MDSSNREKLNYPVGKQSHVDKNFRTTALRELEEETSVKLAIEKLLREKKQTSDGISSKFKADAIRVSLYFTSHNLCFR